MDKKPFKHLRAGVQSAFTALSNGYLVGFLEGKIYTGPTKALCLPGLNCYSCPGALGSCPIGSLQAVLGSRQFSVSFYILGFLMAVGALWGRFCLRLALSLRPRSDLLYKILFPATQTFRGVCPEDDQIWDPCRLCDPFLPLLAVDVTGLESDPWFCKYICPSGTLMAGLPLLASNTLLRSAIGWLFAWKLTILAILLLLALMISRPFCRYFCPLGVLYGLMNKVSLYRLELDESLCIRCGKCEAACELNIPVLTQQNSMECIRCGDCKNACPTGALRSTLDRYRREKKTGDTCRSGCSR